MLALAVWVASAPVLLAQQSDNGNAGKPVDAAGTAPAQPPVADDRQKTLQADADQLVALAEALRDSVEKANKDELSVEVIRRAEQIERLAKQMRDQPREQ